MRTALWIVGLLILGLILILSLNYFNIRGLVLLGKVEKSGIPIRARIVSRHEGLEMIEVEYELGNSNYRKELRVSTAVYESHRYTDFFSLRALNEDPRIITWSGNRDLHKYVFSLVLSMVPFAIMVIAFLRLLKSGQTMV